MTTPQSNVAEREEGASRGNPTVTTISMTIANAYLVRGERSVLVDTGGPGSVGKIVEALAQRGWVWRRSR